MIRVQLKYSDGRTQMREVAKEKLVIGSGPKCDIPWAGLAAEHLLLEHVGSGVVMARALSFHPAPQLYGTAFQQTKVPSQVSLHLAGVELTVSYAAVVPECSPAPVSASMPVSAAQASAGEKARQRKSGPLLYVSLVLAVPALGLMFYGGRELAGGSDLPEDVPVLWAASEAQCPQTLPEQALTFAREKWVIAESKRERRPFNVQDGVAAVPLYELASACYRAGGQHTEADAAADTAKLLRKQVDEDYRMHRVRLEHALSVDDTATVQKEARVLLAFTTGKSGRYVTWLGGLDRKYKQEKGAHS